METNLHRRGPPDSDDSKYDKARRYKKELAKRISFRNNFPQITEENLTYTMSSNSNANFLPAGSTFNAPINTQIFNSAQDYPINQWNISGGTREFG